MSGNPLPWIVLAGVVIASLAIKGYLKLPSAKPHPQPQFNTPTNSYLLGLEYYKALKAEAEEGMLAKLSFEQAALVKERMTAPFSTPETAVPPAAPKS